MNRRATTTAAHQMADRLEWVRRLLSGVCSLSTYLPTKCGYSSQLRAKHRQTNP